MAERKAFLLRLDPGLHDAMQRWAGAELRSLNAQIEFVLRRAVRERESGSQGAREPEDSPPPDALASLLPGSLAPYFFVIES